MTEKIKKESAPKKVERGSVVTISGKEWIVLKIEDNKVHCVLKDFLPNMQFDTDSNNYADSNLRDWLNDDFLSELDVEPLEHEVDLLSLDGQTEYGKVTDAVSLMTVDMYRENRDILPNTDKWWWLATPWSTKCNDVDYSVCCVSPGGSVCSNSYDNFIAVRPFCIFPFSIFES